VEIAERRADLAREQLRRWLLSHGDEVAPGTPSGG
jgi:hypothetical protein